jgi:Bacterial Ig-like domain
MVERMGFGKSGRGAWPLLGLALLACSGIHHSCFETRDCDSPKGFIEAGTDDTWWAAGAGGEAELFDPAPASSAAGYASSPADAGAGGTGSLAQEDAPSISSLLPVDGATGIRSDAQIVVRFAQAMAEASVEAAFQASDRSRSELSFAWNATSTTLTITPHLPFVYASGATQPDGSPAFEPKTYSFGFDASARDREGRALPALSFSFSTLRRVSYDVPTDPHLTGNWTDGEGEGTHNCLRNAKAPYAPSVCIGDDASNVRYTGFLSFDLSALPAGISEFSSARLSATAIQYGTPSSLGDSRLEHISFNALDDSTARSAALGLLGPFYANASVIDLKYVTLSEDVTSAITDDYTNRSARSNRSQYRLSFAKVLADWAWDDIELATANIHLAAAYLIP